MKLTSILDSKGEKFHNAVEKLKEFINKILDHGLLVIAVEKIRLVHVQ